MIYTEAELPIDKYHARNHVSHSKYRDLAAHGPRGYFARHIARTVKQEDSPAFAFGRAAEDYLRFALDGSRHHLDGYAFRPDDIDGRTKAGKEWAAEHAGKTILSGADEAALRAIADNALSNSKIAALLRDSEAQLTFDTHGCPSWPGEQSRPDWYCRERGYSLDLKTTNSFAELANGSRVVSYGYHSQTALVLECAEHCGVNATRAGLIIAEKAPPNRVALAWLDAEFIDIGHAWLERQRTTLRELYAADTWPLVEHEELVICAPKWAVEEW